MSWKTPEDADRTIYAADRAWYLRKYGIDLDHYPSKSARYRLNIKLEAFEAYGGCHCDWCDVTDIVILTIDHVYQDGATQRRQGQPQGGSALYYWLKRQGYPHGYRVLCYNHNIMAAWLAKRGIYQDRNGNPIGFSESTVRGWLKPATNGHLIEG
jgi:hypothetical protein